MRDPAQHRIGVAHRVLASAALALLGMLLAPPPAEPGEDYDLDRIVASNVFRPEDLPKIRKGEIVWRTWTEFSDRDIGIALAFLLPSPPEEVVDSLIDDLADVHYDDRAVHTEILPTDATLAHFEALTLEPRELERYLNARPGTDLNLSRAELERFAALRAAGAGSGEVLAAVRELLLERLRSYREGGLAGIAPYARKRGGDLDVGAMMARDIRLERAHALTPHFRDVMARYPKHDEPSLHERFAWIEYAHDDRPTIVLRHRMALRLGRTWAMMERDFYVSRFYNGAQGFWAVLPSEGGTLVFYGVRSNTEQARGLGARLKRSLGRHIMAGQLVELIELQRRHSIDPQADPAR